MGRPAMEGQLADDALRRDDTSAAWESVAPARLPAMPGEWIDRRRVLSFTFEGRQYTGYAGDTISSALAAAGVSVLGRSFKYHRQRGVLSFANHDVNAMMQDGEVPNVRADVTPLAPGMDLTAVNTFGGLRGDRARVLDKLSALLPVGFYYKAFHTPRSWFPRWEKLFRTMTGLGEVHFDAPRIRTAKRYDFCDVLVVGSGASGLSAALAAASAGAKVLVIDEAERAGGSLGYSCGGASAAADTLRELLRQVEASPNIELRPATTAAGYYADHWLPLVDAKRMTKLRARAVVVAAGAYEQPAVFRNNDLPGIMLGSAAQRLIYRYSVRPMRTAVVLAGNSDAYRVALDLRAHGVFIAAVVDLRPGGERSPLGVKVESCGIRVLRGHCIYEALPSRDRGGVQAAIVARLDAEGKVDLETAGPIACDGIVMSVGWAPAAPLLYQAGAKMRFAAEVQQFVPGQLPAGVFAAGRVNGVHGLERKLADGRRAGIEAAAFLGLCTLPLPQRLAPDDVSPSHPYPIVDHPKGKNFVDFDEDLQLKDFVNAVQEGFDSVELLKRYTTVGMGPSQGKHSSMNAIRVLARLTGRSIDEVGTTTSRPFFHPVPFGHLAGRGFTPERQTPLKARHEAAGAVWMQAGAWLRPEYYARDAQGRDAAIRDEVRAVRGAVGLIDVGTLGKIEVYGPDAGEFLERVYTGLFKNLKVGMTRYAIMTDESGVLIDDGVVARLADEQYYFTTTTSGSATVYRELTRLNTMWRLDVRIVNVTGAYAAMNLAGPKSRRVLAKLAGFDVGAAAFPYLALREGEVAGVAARVMRVGFVGELGYEIHVPADCASHVWDQLSEAGAEFGIRPFGVEAQRRLRLEKGHIIIGQDTDGLTSPYDAALAWAVKLDKPFFVGQRSLRILQRKRAKQQLVGFALAPGFAGAPPRECHLVIRGGEIAGRVTSVAYSDTLGQVIGMAMVAPDLARPGTRIDIRVDGSLLEASVVEAPFYDPAAARQKLED